MKHPLLVTSLLLAAGFAPAVAQTTPDHYRILPDVAVAAPSRFAVNVEFGNFAPWNVDQRVNAWNLFNNLEPMLLQYAGQCDGGGVDFALHTSAPRFSFWDCARSGYWDGAHITFYRLENGVLNHLRTSRVKRSVTGNDPVTNEKTEEKMYLADTGPAIRSGDFYVLNDTRTEVSPRIRPALMDNAWGTNFLLDGWCNFQGRVNWRFDTSTFAPEGGSTASLRMELRDASPANPSGPWHWFMINNSDEPHIHLTFRPGKAYKARVWLKQEGMSDPRAFVQLGCFTSTTVEVGTEWKQYEFDLPVDHPERALPNRQNSGSRLLIGGLSNGTLWMDNLLVWQTDVEPYAILPHIVEALREFRPGALRLWDGLGAPTLDAWLSSDFAQVNIGTYAKAGRLGPVDLYRALRLCEEIKTEPWLIVNPYFSREDHLGLMEYLAAPADVGYGRIRAKQGHPEPWTATFKTIHLECGNEMWNSIMPKNLSGQPEVYAAFADRQFRDYKSSPFYQREHFEFIANGWDNQMQPQGWTHRVSMASRHADRIDIACYFGGWEQGATPLAGEQGDLTDEIYQDKLFGTPIEFGRKMVQSLVMNPDLTRSLCAVLKDRPDLLARGMERYQSGRVRWVMSQLEPAPLPDPEAVLADLWARDTNFNDSIRSVLAHRRHEVERGVWAAAFHALGSDPALQDRARTVLNLPDRNLLPDLCDGLADLNAPSRLLPLMKAHPAVVARWLEDGFLDGPARADLAVFSNGQEKLTYNITNDLGKKLRELVMQLAGDQDPAFIKGLSQVATAEFLRAHLRNLDYSTRGMFQEPGYRRAEQLMLAMKNHPDFAEATIRYLAGETSIFETTAARVASEFASSMAGIYGGGMTHPSHPDKDLLLRRLPPAMSRTLITLIRDQVNDMLGTFSRESQLFMPAMLEAAMGNPGPAQALAGNEEFIAMLAQQMKAALPQPFLEAAQQDVAFGDELLAQMARDPSPGAKGIAVYEGGPGYALPGPNKPPSQDDENLGKSLVMGTATLDCFLQFLSLNVSPLGYYQFKSGSHWASHNNAVDMIPYPSWLSLQMVNQHMEGDLMAVERVAGVRVDVPDKEIIRTSNDGKGSKGVVPGRRQVPLSVCHAFRSGNRYTVVLLNRDLKHARPIRLDLPGKGREPSRVFALTHRDPRTHNRSSYEVRITEAKGPVLASGMVVTVPPASALLLVGETE
jgi:hypothetical protein